jgi:predicted nucleotidyltransferase
VRATGIVAEYNPFHNGHRHHVAEIRRLAGDTALVAAMSGCFVQRGEPALFDKWARAEMAVRGGVDLVLELPTAFAVRSAQYFAAGAVRLLSSLGVVDRLSFGAENPDLEALRRLAAASGSEEAAATLRRRLDRGETYAAALGKSLAAACGLPAAMAAAPNNILAVEYLRALGRYAPDIVPLPVARRGAGYHDTEVTGEIASATAIRTALLAGRTDAAYGAMPPAGGGLAARLAAEGRGPVVWTDFAQGLLAGLRGAALSELAALPDVSEGLEYKLKAAGRAGSLEELLSILKSKRYPRTRLQRILVHSLLRTRRVAVAAWDESGPLYARVLAFSDRGRGLLRAMARKAAVPVVTKTAHFLSSREMAGTALAPAAAMLALDAAATDVYCLGMANPIWRRGGQDFRRSPLYLP